VKKPYKKKVLNSKPKQISERKMTNETTENFLQVMATFEWPEPKPVFYRLYYNDDGTPKCYTMEDLPGKYLEIDRDTYVACSWNVRVVDKKLQIISPAVTIHKLQPSSSTGIYCDPSDVCVVVTKNQPHTKWKLTANETH
jgi:hypothetical protein